MILYSRLIFSRSAKHSVKGRQHRSNDALVLSMVNNVLEFYDIVADPESEAEVGATKKSVIEMQGHR